MSRISVTDILKLEPYQVVRHPNSNLIWLISFEDTPLKMHPYFFKKSAQKACDLMNCAYQEGVMSRD